MKLTPAFENTCLFSFFSIIQKREFTFFALLHTFSRTVVNKSCKARNRAWIVETYCRVATSWESHTACILVGLLSFNSCGRRCNSPGAAAPGDVLLHLVQNHHFFGLVQPVGLVDYEFLNKSIWRLLFSRRCLKSSLMTQEYLPQTNSSNDLWPVEKRTVIECCSDNGSLSVSSCDLSKLSRLRRCVKRMSMKLK